MKDAVDEKKKRTPKRKEKRRRPSAAISIAASDQNYDSPYQDSSYKVPNTERTKRSNSKLNLQSPSIIKENGVFVDTLFPSEHLVAMSIVENEHNEADQLDSIAEDPPLDLATPNEIPRSYDPSDRNQILVKDPDTKELVTTKCIAGREDSVFVGPAGAEPKPTDPYVLSRCLIQKRFGAGVLLLRPMEMKPTQLVTRGDLIFQLWYGRVSLTIHETTSVIVSGDFFFVPRGNTYSVKNLRNEEAKFSYTVVKEVPPEKEAADKEIMERKDRESKLGQLSAREGTFVTEIAKPQDESLQRPNIEDTPKDNVIENTPRPKSIVPDKDNEHEHTTNKGDDDDSAEKTKEEPILTPQLSIEPTEWKPVVV
ncbi:uncharacterized protein LOC110460835 [Mizuhopecten yessoensis]|uniref:Centromere protein C 1 n=1 Tax=Mizuhopecten yessoensis TaxID=6573 RepID=A0A210Q1J4_MIZYE|nr:uncharacterized protein LOC110460835 [Mizuhopecten yessoensis]OWF42606.1 Centromere protein C 1 [Mizuhopecten yessoensis]